MQKILQEKYKDKWEPIVPETGQNKLLWMLEEIGEGNYFMKKLITWTIFTILLMIGCPWLAVTFAGDAGMAVCFLLFFGINPIFAAVCGVFAGKNIKELWILPIIVAALFLAGVWLFFEMGEPAFLLYGGGYLIIGIVAMLISSFIYFFRKTH